MRKRKKELRKELKARHILNCCCSLCPVFDKVNAKRLDLYRFHLLNFFTAHSQYKRKKKMQNNTKNKQSRICPLIVVHCYFRLLLVHGCFVYTFKFLILNLFHSLVSRLSFVCTYTCRGFWPKPRPMRIAHTCKPTE